MSNNKKNNKNKKNRKNFTLEALEPRLMLSATAEDAARDYIATNDFAEQIVNQVKNNVEKLNFGTVEIDGQKLSINDLLIVDGLDTSNVSINVEKSGSDNKYTVKMGDLALNNKSIENLTVDVKGQKVTGLKGSLATTVKIDSMTMQITEADNDFNVEKVEFGDVSLESNIEVNEAEKAKVSHTYLNLIEQKADSESDLKIKVSSDKSGADVKVVSYDLEFDADSSVVTFEPDMKVKGDSTGSSSDFSYANLTLKSNVSGAIDNLANIANGFTNGSGTDKIEYIKNIQDGSKDVDWNAFATDVRHYAAAAFVARDVAKKTSGDIVTLYEKIVNDASWKTLGLNKKMSTEDVFVLTKTLNAEVDCEFFRTSGVPVTLEISLKLSDSGVDVESVSLSAKKNRC